MCLMKKNIIYACLIIQCNFQFFLSSFFCGGGVDDDGDEFMKGGIQNIDFYYEGQLNRADYYGFAKKKKKFIIKLFYCTQEDELACIIDRINS